MTVPTEDRFTPYAITIQTGDSIKWVNTDSDAHTVVSDDPFNTAGHQGANELLQSASSGRADYLQLMRIGGVSGSRLTEVEATRYRSNGQVLNFIKARDARVVVDRTKRTVEFVFTDGQILLGGNGVPFPGGTFTTIVAEGDAISQWTGSGLVFVTTK